MAMGRHIFAWAMALATAAAAWAPAAHAQGWVPFASISPTTTLQAGRLCYTDGRDLACDANAPLLSGGLLQVDRLTSGTTSVVASTNSSVTITVAGAQRAVFGVNGGLDISGTYAEGTTIRASNFIGASGYRVWSNAGATPGTPALSRNGATTTGMFFPDDNAIGFSALSTEAVRIVSTGWVGIGTTSPTSRLTLLSNGGNTALLSWGNTSASSILSTDQGGSIELGTRINTLPNPINGGTPFIDFHYGNGLAEDFNTRLVNNGDRRFAIQVSGSTALQISGTRLGIGTTEPSSTLHVSGISNSTGGLTIGASNGGGERLRLYSVAEASARIEMANPNGTLQFMSGSSMLLALNGISSTSGKPGGIGIGTSVPSTSLHVAGTLRLTNGGEACDADRAGGIRYNSGTFEFCAGSAWQSLAAVAAGGAATPDRIIGTNANVVAANGAISFTTGGVSGTAYLDAAGRFVVAGISTTGQISATEGGFGRISVGNLLDLGGSGASYGALAIKQVNNTSTGGLALVRSDATASGRIFIDGANTLQITRATASETLAFTTDGRMGIGTTRPSATLHVSGSVRLGFEDIVCNADRAGGIRFNSGTFEFCAGSAWQALSGSGGGGDRIVSTSANVVAGNGGTISFTTGGVSGTAYFDTLGRLVTPGISTTGVISTTRLYLQNVAGDTSGLSLVSLTSLGEGGGGGGGSFSGDRISTSGVTSGSGLAMAVASAGTISFTLAGTEGAAYLHPTLGLVASGVSTTGVISTTRLYLQNVAGDSSGLSLVSLTSLGGGSTTPDRIVGTNANAVAAGGTISFTTGGVSGTAYFATTGVLVAPGVSTTGGISATTLTASSLGGVSGSVILKTASGQLSAGNSVLVSASGALLVGNPSWPAWFPSAGGLVVSGTLSIQGSAASPLVLSNDAYIGWGSSLSNIRGSSASDGYLRFDTGGTEAVRIVSTGYVGIRRTAPQTLLDVSGTLRIGNGGETCNTNRAGGIRYNAGTFEFCAGSSWQALGSGSSASDRIVGTNANAVAAGGTISFTTGGVSGTAYFATTGVLVAPGVSTTGRISATSLYGSVILPVQNVAGVTNNGIQTVDGSLLMHTFRATNTDGPNLFIGLSSGNQTMSRDIFAFQASENTAVGYGTLDNTTHGYANTAMGLDTLGALTSGDSNSGFGVYALNTLTTGSNNTAVGRYAGGNVLDGSNNTLLGYNTGLGLTSGSNNTIVGANVQGLPTSLNNHILLADGGGTIRILVNESGRVGIGTGTNNPANELDVSGTIRATNVVYTSDRRAKTDIKPLANAASLVSITALQPVSFRYKTGGNTQLGLIAQDTLPILPEVVDTQVSSSLAVNYPALVPVLIGAAKELKQENDALKAKYEALLQRVEALEQRLGN